MQLNRLVNRVLPPAASGIMLFAHGSSRLSPHSTFFVNVLQQHGIGTLLFDLAEKIA